MDVSIRDLLSTELGDAFYFAQKDRNTCPRGCEFAVDAFEMGEIAGCCQQSMLRNMKSKVLYENLGRSVFVLT